VAVVRVAVVLSGNCPRWQFHKKSFNRFFKTVRYNCPRWQFHKKSFNRFFKTVRYFRDPIQVLRISENRVPKLKKSGSYRSMPGT